MNAEERVMSRLMPGDLSVLILDNQRWLGCLNEEDHNLVDCFNFGKDNISIERWFLAWNIENLTNLKLSKMASYSVRKLNPPEIEEFEKVKAKMLRAKRYALNYWENEVYQKHM